MKENHKQRLFLGLDTSAYTTSLALVDQDEKLIIDSRLPLLVKKGSLGLRQSEAVFNHIINLPQLWQKEVKALDNTILTAIAVSTRPRPVDGSYMPVFKVSEAFGLFLAQTMGLCYFPSSHQEGHIFAGLWSVGLPQGRYLVIHLSGGTTELVSSEEIISGRLTLELLGGSTDLHAGQFVDRLGLAMDLDFPAGPKLEELARQSGTDLPELPVAVKGCGISFSGPASHAERLLKQNCRRENLARAIEICIADSLIAAVNNCPENPANYQGLLTIGGVAANHFIRERLKQKLTGWNLFSPRPELASDNAVGLAVQAARLHSVNY
ncbi:MAG: O-sialoglycoprotein endopeptidase [Clostridia bacterium]|nr:O-sialoglycoprotein endopeptidase [Clostridia bacterium]